MSGLEIEQGEHLGERGIPPAETIERWCWDFVTTRVLTEKLVPRRLPAVSDEASWETSPIRRLLSGPGRPAELVVTARSGNAPRGSALAQAAARAQLLHTFVHHELQAAELFAWAVLAFPETPRAFRSGLVRLCQEELAHMELYREHMHGLGVSFGAHPVRDWFWQRVVHCTDAASFVALQGVGLEGANLEHSARFAAQFRAIGDEEGARILERVERDEIAHVAFAVHWFEHFTGAPLDYDRWSAALPAPLTPSVLRGQMLNRDARRRAGLDDAFLARLEAAPSTGLRRST
jgi:uncharacterized ferritin-like protein (DUF455 family)